MPTIEVNSLRSREEDMSQYYVDMSKLDMQPEKISIAASQISNTAARLENFVSNIGSESAVQPYKRRLCEICISIDNIASSVLNSGRQLESIVECYRQTENKLCDNAFGSVSVDNGSGSGAQNVPNVTNIMWPGGNGMPEIDISEIDLSNYFTTASTGDPMEQLWMDIALTFDLAQTGYETLPSKLRLILEKVAGAEVSTILQVTSDLFHNKSGWEILHTVSDYFFEENMVGKVIKYTGEYFVDAMTNPNSLAGQLMATSDHWYAESANSIREGDICGSIINMGLGMASDAAVIGYGCATVMGNYAMNFVEDTFSLISKLLS